MSFFEVDCTECPKSSALPRAHDALTGSRFLASEGFTAPAIMCRVPAVCTDGTPGITRSSLYRHLPPRPSETMRQWPQHPLWVSRLIYGPLNSERWTKTGEFQEVGEDGTPIFSFRAECAWPVKFRSGDDFRIFVERMSAVAARSPVHPVAATCLRAEGMDLDEFLRRGDRSLQEIALTTNAPKVSNVYVKFKHGSGDLSQQC